MGVKQLTMHLHGLPLASQVLDEMVQILTEPRFKGKMVVILAGYEAQVDELMLINPGLKSRFSEKLHFADFSVEDACSMLRRLLTGQQGLTLSPSAEEELPRLMHQVGQPLYRTQLTR
jgi:hypothetical protein